MAEYVFTMNGVGKTIQPRKEILRDIYLSFFPGAKIGVLGLNGSGKSTLLKIMAGLDKDYLGEARPQAGIKIGYLPQEPHLEEEWTVRENVELGVKHVIDLLHRFNAISDQFAEPMSNEQMECLLHEQGELQGQIDAVNGWELERQLEVAADALRLAPWDSIVKNLSGGEKRRVALCQLLLEKPDMLLLDEPTNHLDAHSVAWLERFLHDYAGTVVAVTHDRYFLDNVASWILELDRGHGIPYEGNYTNWLEQKEARLGLEDRQEQARQRTLKAELEWVRSNPKGKRAKSKARLDRFEELNSADYQKRNETLELYIPPGPRLGDVVFEAKGLSKGFGDRVLIDDLTFLMPKGAILGVVGPNGAGKSTFLKMLMGLEQPDSGELVIGSTVQLSYVDQSRAILTSDNTVWQEISNGLDYISVGTYQMPSRAYIGRFNFKGTDQQKLVKDLSGGERNRLHLATVLKSGGNVLLLDEPTNDLDVETLRSLEEAVLNFPGSAIVVSHDRWFLDRVVTHILAFEGDSKVTWFEGSYSDYVADSVKRLGDAPTRIKYKKIDL